MRKCRECMERPADSGHRLCGACKSKMIKARIDFYVTFTKEHGKPTLESLPEFRKAMKKGAKQK